MENKGVAYDARRLVCEKMLDPMVCSLLSRLRDLKPQIFTHSINSAYLTAQVAYSYGYGGDIGNLVLGALLHDIGMICVADNILETQGDIPEAWMIIIRRHTGNGASMLYNMGFSKEVADAARMHHERLDGSGYPRGFLGCDIPMGVKIISACDAYEALTTERPYRPAINVYEALDMMPPDEYLAPILKALKSCSDI